MVDLIIKPQVDSDVPWESTGERCVCVSVGQVGFLDVWDLQKTLHRQVADGLLPHQLLLLEHPHVYTLGRRGTEADVLVSLEEIARLGAEVHYIDRGGQATYHGPGQLIGYPILDLHKWGSGPLKYVCKLEEVLIATLAEFGIEGESTDRPTGVWVGESKIAAIGVRISRGVTMHGFALNVHTDNSYFDNIVPCGMPDSQATSMASELSAAITIPEVMPVLTYHFGRVLRFKME